MKQYGYCRISTTKQNIERQVRNIKDYCKDAIIIKEEYTGTSMNRKEWNKLFQKVESGDTIIFDSVSRMSRQEEGFAVYEELYNKGVNLVFLKEPHINTEVYRNALNNTVSLTGGNIDFIIEGINNYLMALAKEQIQLAFIQSQKEVDDLRIRTKEGLATAALNGKQIGGVVGSKYKVKKKDTAKKQIEKYSATFGGNLNDIECMKLIGLSRNTYYKYKKELIEGV